MSDNGHAKLSPSAAERWMTCPGSVVLSEGMPNKSSSFADEGTAAHAVAEALLLGKATKADIDVVDNVMVYVDHVQSLGGEFHAEQRVSVNAVVYGTADAVVWQPETAALHIVDLKYGAGEPVEVHGNLQLKIYALATLLTFKYPAHTVTSTIVQPRCPHSDGPVRSVTYDVVDLLDFHADLLDGIDRVESAKELTAHSADWQQVYLQPSEKGCRWCLAAPECPKLKSKAQELAKQVFAPSLPYDAKALSETLDFLPILEGWIKNTREFAYGEAEQGREVPNWKLVEKVANRKFKEGAADLLIKDFGLLPEQVFKPRDMLGVTEIQKLVPGKNDKLRAEALAPYVTKESSGHTLVHESDKRPAVKLDAASAFSSVK
ncbi:Protein of unknown function DUF2800 [uncultured Caudovirales phage]|uniref:DUF2800 domain-containing protein n=1 Tax=uncultured Caudovirales phage TaxID=2100421 RepID=A0A6J7W1Q6_9CAUD|nr:Protein of unknown function DUF2800 [uncultured Caudovirales phage]